MKVAAISASSDTAKYDHTKPKSHQIKMYDPKQHLNYVMYHF